LEQKAVIPFVTAPIIYDVPLILEKAHVGEYILSYFKLKARQQPDWKEWEKIIFSIQHPKHHVKIAIIGKYVELHDAYISVREALKHAALKHYTTLDILWIHSTDLEMGRSWDLVKQADGIVVPGGFGSRGIEGKILAAKYARENKIPYLGLCLGMQLMVVEFARSIFNSEKVNSTEFAPSTPYPVIDLMPEQNNIINLGGTMRLGLYPCRLIPGTIAARAYKTNLVEERHRHRFELNNNYRDQLSANGMSFSGLSPDDRLVEIAEIKNHPFMIGTQFHPEFLSRPNHPHPLFDDFIKTALLEQKKRNQP